MEIIWACAGGLVLMTVALAFVRARECRRIELMAQTIDD